MTPHSDSTGNTDLLEATQNVLNSISIPSPPRVLIGIQEELSYSAPSFTNILALISEDVAMTAKVIRVANSPFFATRYPIKSLEMALPVLGLENFRNIILTSALRQAFEQHGVANDEMERFHEHALIAGKTCQTVAMHLDWKDNGRRVDNGEAYMAGLFHDCGMPLLGQRFSGYFTWLADARKNGINALEYEEEMMQTNHCMIGGFVAKAWQLPENVRGAIAFHQGAFPQSEKECIINLAAVVYVAEMLITHVAELDASEAVYYPTDEDVPTFHEAVAWLGLEESDLGTLLHKIGNFFPEAEPVNTVQQ